MKYNITDLGVTPNANRLQTEEIQKALDDCKGGTIVFPAGTYIFSGVLMRSDTTIYLESGAVYLAEQFHRVKVFPAAV